MYRKNKWTEEDIKKINSRMINVSIGVMPSKDNDIDVMHASSTNKKRHVIATKISQNMLTQHVYF